MNDTPAIKCKKCENAFQPDTETNGHWICPSCQAKNPNLKRHYRSVADLCIFGFIITAIVAVVAFNDAGLHLHLFLWAGQAVLLLATIVRVYMSRAPWNDGTAKALIWTVFSVAFAFNVVSPLVFSGWVNIPFLIVYTVVFPYLLWLHITADKCTSIDGEPSGPETETSVDKTNNATDPGDAQNPPTVDSDTRQISGFWRRLAAFIIDGLVLGVVGWVAGFFLFDFLAGLGVLWGRAIGFSTALLYFGILNSARGGGQSIGKRLMSVEVVDRSGQHISMPRSFLRYAILGLPFFLNGAITASEVVWSPLSYPLVLLIFGFGGAIIYLYIFNRRTRQSLHDLICGTFVTRTASSGRVTGTVWRLHLGLVGVWFVIVIVGSMALSKVVPSEMIHKLEKLQRAVRSSPNIYRVAPKAGTQWQLGGDPSGMRYVLVTAFCRKRPDDYKHIANDVASIVMKNYSGIMEMDRLSVTIVYGYDIGLSSAWVSYSYSESPAEWRKTLSEKAEGK